MTNSRVGEAGILHTGKNKYESFRAGEYIFLGFIILKSVDEIVR